MRDLKHLIYFEDLLQEANNELVRKGKEDGNLCLGYTCYFMPEVLLDLPGCFAVRLRAPKCTSPDMASYYMSGRTCHYGRSLLERALEGGYNFILMAPDMLASLDIGSIGSLGSLIMP